MRQRVGISWVIVIADTYWVSEGTGRMGHGKG
jgi:hypothetical protein